MTERKPSSSGSGSSTVNTAIASHDFLNPNSGSTTTRGRLLERPIRLMPNVIDARLYTMCPRHPISPTATSMGVWDQKKELERAKYLKEAGVRLMIPFVGPPFGGLGALANISGASVNGIDGSLTWGMGLSDGVTPGGAGRAIHTPSLVANRTPQIQKPNDGVTILRRKRLRQDVEVKKQPPEAREKDRLRNNKDSNEKLKKDIEHAKANGGRNIRVDQHQVNAAGERVGLNSPSLQYTTMDGQRIYIIYDGSPARIDRILANDPNGQVIYRK